jgi:hypothetical protein
MTGPCEAVAQLSSQHCVPWSIEVLQHCPSLMQHVGTRPSASVDPAVCAVTSIGLPPESDLQVLFIVHDLQPLQDPLRWHSMS